MLSLISWPDPMLLHKTTLGILVREENVVDPAWHFLLFWGDGIKINAYENKCLLSPKKILKQSTSR